VAVGGRGSLIGPVLGAVSSMRPKAGSPWLFPNTGCFGWAVHCHHAVPAARPAGPAAPPKENA
jgi:hypothetical protein